ncbi:MAG: antibiotic biosynthesis monooxygenase [Desulfobacteraceae bacterium]|jgi:heme-degrading monooxygenase HmoA|nr:MAG: antibiotic biosynthesis monooxygenase [Desulfobacteraceae bacterium]
MAVKILISRRIPKEKEEEILPLLIELRSLAVSQPGYISGETLRNIRDPEDYVVISTWHSTKDWDSWVGSALRSSIQEKIDSILGEKTSYKIYLHG